ncbi:SMR family transporter [Acinetobacter baumannii]
MLREDSVTSALKASQCFALSQPPVYYYGCGSCSCFYLLFFTLKTIPIGIAYAIWSGAGIILISAIGWIFYKQHLDLAACIGLALMIAGIVIINVFSKNTHL